MRVFEAPRGGRRIVKRHTAEEVIAKLRQAEADLTLGLSLAQICQRRRLSEPTLHR